MFRVNPGFQVPDIQNNKSKLKKVPENNGKNFGQILKNQLQKDELKFSSHAQQRMKERGIKLSQPQQKRLETAVENARNKGGSESLIMIDNNAFVVSVKNNTVITAVDEKSLNENVFTNIDSAVMSL
ncbi:MAG: TIGR02530 family flagellar biosynthesis protein [Candidatus Muiribacteriota bacterium]